MHNGLARPSAFGGGGCCWLETERGSVGAWERRTHTRTGPSDPQTAQLAQGLAAWVLAAGPFSSSWTHRPVHSDRSSLSHTPTLTLFFLSCPFVRTL